MRIQDPTWARCIVLLILYELTSMQQRQQIKFYLWSYTTSSKLAMYIACFQVMSIHACRDPSPRLRMSSSNATRIEAWIWTAMLVLIGYSQPPRRVRPPPTAGSQERLKVPAPVAIVAVFGMIRSCRRFSKLAIYDIALKKFSGPESLFSSTWIIDWTEIIGLQRVSILYCRRFIVGML